MLRNIAGAVLSIAAMGAVLAPAAVRAEDADVVFMPRTMTVTLLNEGGKYVTVDMKHIPQGGTCRMDEGAIVVRVEGGAAGMTRMRYLAPQTHSGGCPFLTTFDIPNDDFKKAQADFATKEAAAKAKVEEIKKSIGDKWNEIVGNKG